MPDQDVGSPFLVTDSVADRKGDGDLGRPRTSSIANPANVRYRRLATHRRDSTLLQPHASGLKDCERRRSRHAASLTSIFLVSECAGLGIVTFKTPFDMVARTDDGSTPRGRRSSR